MERPRITTGAAEERIKRAFKTSKVENIFPFWKIGREISHMLQLLLLRATRK